MALTPRALRTLHLLPRTLAILFIIFISLFALDMFGGEEPFWKQIAGFLIHLMPSYVLIIILYIAHKRELLGGIFFLLPGLIYILLAHDYLAWIVIIAGPLLLIGGLFILNHYIKKKRAAPQSPSS